MREGVRVGDQTVEITRGDKVFFPDSGITKRDLVEYYQKIADRMLPYLEGRPITMVRFPDGIKGEGFFHKDTPRYYPKWIKRVRVKKEDGFLNQIVCDDADTLIYLANQACIAPHIWLSRADHLNKPDLMVFDLDPPDGRFPDVRFAAKALRQQLTDLDLVPFVQTTGSRGLHIVVPLTSDAEFDEVREFARAVADSVAQGQADRLTTEQYKKKRRNRIFIDTARNSYAQTFVCPYGVRPLPGAPVATPIDWEEVDRTEPKTYSIGNIFKRLRRKKDPWAEIWNKARPLDVSGRKMGAKQKQLSAN